MAMVQKGGEPCPAPLAKSCKCDMSFSIRPWQKPVAFDRILGSRLPRESVGQAVQVHCHGSSRYSGRRPPGPEGGVVG
jgi:hypothetical protein